MRAPSPAPTRRRHAGGGNPRPPRQHDAPRGRAAGAPGPPGGVAARGSGRRAGAADGGARRRDRAPVGGPRRRRAHALARHFATRPRRWPIAPAMREADGPDDPRTLSRCRGGRGATRRRHRRRPLRSARLSRPPLRRLTARAGTRDDAGVDGDRLASRSRPRPRRAGAVLERGAVSRSGLRRSQDHLGAEPPPALPGARPGLVAGRASAGARRRSSGISPAGWTPTRRSSGINWASMLELALRSLSWIWALELFVEPAAGGDRATTQPIDAQPWLVDLLLGLDRQLHLVEQNLSTYFSPNTHLLGEALALYVAGRTLPELRRAPAWAELGRRILIEEMSRQISPDGGHVERSFHYHRYTLDFYLLALDGGAPDRRRHAALRRSGPAAGPLRADHRRRSRTPGADRRRRRRPAVSDLRPRQRRRQRLAGAGRLAARRSVARRRSGARRGRVDVGRRRRDRRRRAARPSPIPSTTLGDSGYTVCRTGARRSPGARHRAARLSERRPRPRRRPVDDADRGRPAAPRRSRHGLLHDRPGRAAIASARRACTTRWSSTGASSRSPPARSTGPPRPPDRAWRGARRRASTTSRARTTATRRSVHRRAVFARPGCWIVADRVLGDGDASRPRCTGISIRAGPSPRPATGGSAPTMAPAIPIWIASLDGEFEIVRGRDDRPASPASAGSRRPTATSCPARRCGSSVAARRPSRW